MDRDGLVRSLFSARTLRPITEAELKTAGLGRIVTDMFQNAPDPAKCIAYENALMGTGEFAMSQIVRFKLTGEPSAREQTQFAVQAILAVIREGRHYMPGYLPKPFGGLARARYSHELSVDQYIKAIAALYHWRPLASAEEREAIDQFFVDAAAFFIARKFRHAYRHRTIVTATTHPHSLGLYIALPWLAARASDDARYLQHLEQFDDALALARTTEKLAGFNQTALVIEGFHTAIQAGAADKRLKELVALCWRRAIQNVKTDGRAYELGKLSSQGTRIAAVATLVHAMAPDPGASRLAISILGRLTEVAMMTKPRIPETISTTSITSWLLAYWRLRELGFIPEPNRPDDEQP